MTTSTMMTFDGSQPRPVLSPAAVAEPVGREDCGDAAVDGGVIGVLRAGVCVAVSVSVVRLVIGVFAVGVGVGVAVGVFLSDCGLTRLPSSVTRTSSVPSRLNCNISPVK